MSLAIFLRTPPQEAASRRLYIINFSRISKLSEPHCEEGKQQQQVGQTYKPSKQFWDIAKQRDKMFAHYFLIYVDCVKAGYLYKIWLGKAMQNI